MMKKRKIDSTESSMIPQNKRSISNLRTLSIDKYSQSNPLHFRGSLFPFQNNKELKQNLLLKDDILSNPKGRPKKVPLKKCNLSEEINSFQREFEDFISKERGKEESLTKIKDCYDDCIKDYVRNYSDFETIKRELVESRKRENNLLHFLQYLKDKGIPINVLYSEMESKKKVPFLVFSKTGQDYQDEFMSKYDEFSESWRRQIDKTCN